LRLAGIDIGTNTVRLLIAECGEEADLREVQSERQITRLGENLIRTGNLSETAMARTLNVLKKYRTLCDHHEVAGISAVATSAVREASNGTLFIERILREVPLSVQVISGSDEASITLLGVARDLPVDSPILMMDIGGGSTEFVLYSPSVAFPAQGGLSRSRGEIHYRISTDLGVVRMTETYVHSDPVSLEDLKSLSRAVDDCLDQVRLPAGAAPPVLVGTAGTVTTLSAIHLGLRDYEPRKVHHSMLKRQTVDDLLRRFIGLSVAERLDIPGLEPGREDIILAGTLIVRKVMERFGFEEMWVSDYGLREGVVLTLYDRMR
jgi:exopolyphosphatase/guanosine-5'-triphosphate,3'-diphosphate pyrophosphatase